jgi:hypothetical protein
LTDDGLIVWQEEDARKDEEIRRREPAGFAEGKSKPPLPYCIYAVLRRILWNLQQSIYTA